jgi:hypothetical protein
MAKAVVLEKVGRECDENTTVEMGNSDGFIHEVES